jgi:hypothetical protein
MGDGKQGMFGWFLNHDVSRYLRRRKHQNELVKTSLPLSESESASFHSLPIWLFVPSSPCLRTERGRKAEEAFSPVPIDQVCLDKQGQFFTLNPQLTLFNRPAMPSYT